MPGSMWLISLLILGKTMPSTSETIRLANGVNSCSGRVEVFYDGQWGTVCDDSWDLSDAAVVCREMGCGDAIEAKSAAYFGQGFGKVFLSSLTCFGNESTLSSCGSKKLQEFSCDHSKDAGVTCHSLVRLLNGSSSCSGRVEVLNDGQWGTVCDNGWDLSDAGVVCKEMGCGDVFEHKMGDYFGQGSGPVWLSNLQCSNTDSTLRHCVSNELGQNSCGHEKDAGVACQRRIRLANGFNACSGRVEVSYVQWGYSQWGSVCDNSWDLSDAAVVCREIGCGDAVAAKLAAYFGPGSGVVWLDDVKCTGNEATINACEFKKIAMYTASHSKDAGVICHSPVRLINGNHSCAGRVEVFYDGQWGTVCDNGWDLSDAAVVCRDLGCGDAIEAKSAAYFSQGSGPIWLSDLQCSNNELRLRDCKSSGWGKGSCGHEKDAGVICQDNVRLVNSTNSCFGRVEVLRNGQWGTVCDDGWDASDAAVVCRQLGCGSVLEVKTAAYFGKGSGMVWMSNVNCFGNESALMSCSYTQSSTSCGHERDAGVICGYKGEATDKWDFLTQNSGRWKSLPKSPSLTGWSSLTYRRTRKI